MPLRDLYTARYGWLWSGFYGPANDRRHLSDRYMTELARLPTLLYLAGAADGPGYYNFSHDRA